MMKVLHIESGRHLYGGAKQVLHIMEGLSRRGVDNLLACPRGAEIAAPARQHGEVVEMRMAGDADAGMALRVFRLVARHRPDIVHVHSRRGADLWGGIGARLARVPVVLSRRVDNREPRWLAGLKYPLYDHVIAISEGIRDVLSDAGLPPARLSCVRSAVDARPFLHDYDKAAYRAAHGLAADTPMVGMVAQLIRRKGHRHLIGALNTVLAAHPRLQVQIFGRGPLEAEIRQWIEAQGLTNSVHLMGFVDDLPARLGCLDVVVHPADMEGLGVSLLQAAAAGVPLLACRSGGIPEVVRHEHNGLLVDAGDVSALSAGLIRLLGDAGLRERLGRAGRELMVREFSIEAMCEGNFAVYRQLLTPDGHALPSSLPA